MIQHFEHDLFLLMLNLSQITDEKRIKEIFIDSLNSFNNEYRFEYFSGTNEKKNINIVEIATLKNRFGYLKIIPDIEIPEELKAIIINAAGMLALILENRINNRLLSDEKLLLEEAVKERTGKLEQLNSELLNEIEHRKQAEKELSDIFTMTVDMLCMADISTAKFLKINPAFTQILGYTEEELLSSTFLNLIHPDDVETTRNALENKLKKGKLVNNFENRYRKKDNTYCWLSWVSHPIPEKGITFGVARDITELKNIEKEREELQSKLLQAQKLEALGTLAGGIAHDFNNLLGIILGYIDLSMDEVREDSDLFEYLSSSRKAGLKAKDLISQILNFSRKSDPDKEPADIARIVSESVKLVRSTTPTSIKINLSIDNIQDTILANPTQISQVIINLMTNAVQAIETDGEINVSLRKLNPDNKLLKIPDLEPGSYFLISVADTGTGIPSEIISQIFDPYFTTKESGKGTGLGLSVAYGIVKSHKGTLTVKSSMNKGTTFNVFLPVYGKPLNTIKADSPILKGNESILIVDDEPILVNMQQNTLLSLGYRVTSTTSAIDALNIFSSDPDKYDLIITDMTMPEMTGDKLSEELLKKRPDIPIIICTGYSSLINPEKADKIGIKKYLMKPVSKRQISHAIREVLK
ncbi:MAG: response regulator [Spirochaetes bacterium]|nr:response regulator [Spirochaetota bacterium]